MARERIQGTAFKQTGQSIRLLPGAVVTVRDDSGALADLYLADAAATPFGDSFTTGSDAAYDFYVDTDGTEYLDLEIRSSSAAVDDRIYIRASKAELDTLDTLVATKNTENTLLFSQQRADIDGLLAGQSTTTDVDPTTLTALDGQNRIYQGRIYYWTGSTYLEVTDASQIDPDLNEAFVFANEVLYARGVGGAWGAFTVTAATPAIISPDAPSGVAVPADGAANFTFAAGASSGSSALDDRELSYTNADGSIETVSVGLSGTHSLPLEDGQAGTATVVDINAEGGRSKPSASISFQSIGLPLRAAVPTNIAPTSDGAVVTLAAGDANGGTMSNRRITVVPVETA